MRLLGAPLLALACWAGCAEPQPRDPFSEDRGAVVDPVCSRKVVPGRAVELRHAGTTYWFCSAECRERFVADPSAHSVRP